MKEKIRNYFRLNIDWKREAQSLTILLAAAYGLSSLARLHWALDLFSHFAVQYAIGGLLLGVILLMARSQKFAIIAFAVMLLSASEMYRYVDFRNVGANQTKVFTVVQYNRHVSLFDHAQAQTWITANRENFDLIVLQEANQRADRLARDLTDIYPYNIREARNDAFGMVVMSKFPFLEKEIIDLGEFVFIRAFALRMVIQPPGMREPVEIYALHAVPPMDAEAMAQRNREVLTIGQHIRDSALKNIVMLGDWNLTPYSPYFNDLVKVSGLRERLNNMLPMPTWPAQFKLPFLQIPIDHIMYKGSLTAASIQRGPAMGSDHYPIIATFTAPQGMTRKESAAITTP